MRRAKTTKANGFKYRVLGALCSFFVITIYVTGCGREAKITLTDNYKPTPINLAKSEAAGRSATTGGFSTDTSSASGEFKIQSLNNQDGFTGFGFETKDLLDCTVIQKAKNLNEVSIRFASAAAGSFGMAYTSEADNSITAEVFLPHTEIKKVAYQNAARSSYLADGKAFCAVKTAIVNRKHARAHLDCTLRGISENVHLVGYVSCQILGGLK